MYSARDVWERALGELQLQVNKANFNTWLSSSQGISYQDNVFIVGVPNIFIAEWLSKRLHSLIKKTLTNILGKDIELEIIVCSKDQNQFASSSASRQIDGGTSSKARQKLFNPKYTFDNFIVSDCNRLAFAAAQEVVENPGRIYNPLLIHSNTGQGKTHLLHAIGQAANSNGFKIVYTTAEQFTSQFILAARQREIENFHDKFRDIDTLLFDDIQFMYDKKQSLQCFFQVFNELHSNNRQIVITADCHPKDMSTLSNKLRSRLQWGLVVPVEPADYKTRLAILRGKAATLGMPIPEEVLQTIAERMHDNVRQLEGALAYFTAQARLSGTNITAEVINKFLTVRKDQHEEIIIKTTADYFNLSVEEIISKNRDRKVVLARQIAMYLMRQENNDSFTEIGKILGNRNHATALHGYEKIAGEININLHLSQQISQIKEIINMHKT
ncbi:MAG: chromosomal replication initiator protein DnaA [Chloroflexota bacterium]|nr:chromosomal replication initiator protein DnaA [Chloroflexota bacterium]